VKEVAEFSKLMEDRSRFGQKPGKKDLDQDFGGLDGLVSILHSNINGLDPNDADDITLRRGYFGENRFLAPPSNSFIMLFLEAFTDKTIIILCLAAIISIILGIVFPTHADRLFLVFASRFIRAPTPASDPPGWVEGTAILISVIIVTLTSSINNWSQERQFRKLNESQKNRNIVVYRLGEPVSISIFDLVVGDVVKLGAGDAIPADGVCLQATSLWRKIGTSIRYS